MLQKINQVSSYQIHNGAKARRTLKKATLYLPGNNIGASVRPVGISWGVTAQCMFHAVRGSAHPKSNFSDEAEEGVNLGYSHSYSQTQCLSLSLWLCVSVSVSASLFLFLSVPVFVCMFVCLSPSFSYL